MRSSISAMSKKFISKVMLYTSIVAVSAQAAASSIEYNIAKGLAPLAKTQSIEVLQPFTGEFRVLGTKAYALDEQAKFSPIDFAVSWGAMAKADVAKQIQVQQYDRYLNWRIEKLPLPAPLAMQMVSNMHIIPANPTIAAQIQQVKAGDMLRLKGELVEVKDGDLVWRSSLSSTDVGDGACEVFRVSAIEWITAT